MMIYSVLYLLGWLGLLSSAWVLPARYTLFARQRDALPQRLREVCWRVPLVLALGIYLDDLTRNAPHAAYTSVAFYGIFFSVSALFCVPGVVIYYARKR